MSVAGFEQQLDVITIRGERHSECLDHRKRILAVHHELKSKVFRKTNLPAARPKCSRVRPLSATSLTGKRNAQDRLVGDPTEGLFDKCGRHHDFVNLLQRPSPLFRDALQLPEPAGNDVSPFHFGAVNAGERLSQNNPD